MKKTVRAFAAAIFSMAMLFSASGVFAFDFGGLVNLGKDSNLDGLDTLLGDSSLGKVYKAYSLEFSAEDAYYIGRATAAAILKKYSFYEDAELESYLNKICQTIVANSDEPLPYNGYHVKVLDSDEVNAFSTPAGHILVTRGMVSCATSEDSMAAIIAHEIAHIQLQHGLEAIKDKRINESGVDALEDALSNMPGYKKTMNFITKISDSTKSMLSKAGFDESEIDMGIDLNNLSGFVVDFLVNGYSKEAEFAADKKALSLMAAAGYSPSEMINMLEKMQKVGEFKTHPKPQDRIKEVRKALKSVKVKDTMSFRKSRFAKIAD
ncbi:MAG: M48 family metalloprotease [Treponema sp.]|nr:M48 family metalloprotease [Treponema sp.]